MKISSTTLILVATARGNAPKVGGSLYCGTRHTLHQATWCRSGGQIFPCVSFDRLEAVKNHTPDSSRHSHCRATCSRQLRDIGRRWPSIGYDEHTIQLGNEENSRGKYIAQNGQGPWLFGDMAGQPQPKCYTEGIPCSEQAYASRRIHFGYRTDCQSILVTLSTWWCSCIYIVRKITFTTSYLCKEPPWRRNSNFKCPPNQNNEPSSSGKLWEKRTCKQFGHQKLAILELWLVSSIRQHRWQRGRLWIWYRAAQWDQGSRKPRAVGCECRTKCSWIDSPNIEVKESGGQGVGDGQCNGYMEAERSQEKVGHNALIWFSSFLILLDRGFHVEIYYGRMVSSRLWLSVVK